MYFLKKSSFHIRLPLLGLVTLLTTTSCLGHTEEYPFYWSRIEINDSFQTSNCPNISGNYLDIGEPDENSMDDFKGRHSDHRSLIYNLLSKEDYRIRSKYHISEDVDDLIGNVVEIVQTNNTIEIIVKTKLNEDNKILSKNTFQLEQGDYSCDKLGIHLRSRSEFFIIGISNFLGLVKRTLYHCEDGSLVVKINEYSMGNHTFVPFGAVSEYWIKWSQVTEPVDSSSLNN